MTMKEKCSPETLHQLQDCLYDDCPFKDECFEKHSAKGGLLDINPGRTATQPEGKRGKHGGKQGNRPGFGGRGGRRS